MPQETSAGLGGNSGKGRRASDTPGLYAMDPFELSTNVIKWLLGVDTRKTCAKLLLNSSDGNK
jgi:hypothetical protein